MAQSVQAEADSEAALNFPAKQAATDAPRSVNPALARQSSNSSEPCDDTALLLGQPVQVAAPVAALYVFAKHAVGVPPFGPV